MSDQNHVFDKNWLKAGAGLLYTKHGIQKIVEDVISGFHTRIYHQRNGRYCKTCTTQNVLSCPTRGICGTGRRCNFHDITDLKKQPTNCPNKVCQDIRDEISRNHRFSPPSFKNTRAEKWYENPWEIAKCYMAAGYHEVQSADDTDFTGLVSVILHFEPFQQEVNVNLAQKGNIFEKARESRNSIMHNAKMEIPTSDLPTYFLTMKNILSDMKRVQSSLEVQAALKKINDLENDLITITTEDEMKIREESLRALKELTDKSLEELEQKTTEGKDALDQKTTEGKDALDQKTTEGKDALDQKTTEGRDTLEKKTIEGTNSLSRQTGEHLKNIQTSAASRTSLLNEVGQYLADDLNEITEKGVERLQEIQAITEKGAEKLQEMQAEFEERITENSCRPTTIINNYNYGAPNAVNVFSGQNTFECIEFGGNQASGEPAGLLDEVYLERKKGFQKELIEFYSSSGMTTSPIPVLFDDEDFEVDDIFTMPNMKVVLHEREKTTDKREVKINTIRELFKNDTYIGNVVKRVCIKGEAGYGKTFLCKKIVSSWCKVHSGIQLDKLTETDINFLKSFDLLFYLPLRNSQETTITELVKQVIVRECLHGTLDEILKHESEKCLIILDGLDEYSATVGIPESDPREKYSIVMTSRPWKIESLRPTQRSVGQEIQLTCMENNDSLIEAVVDRLNKKYGGQKDWTKFKYGTWNERYRRGKRRKEYRKIQHLANVPVILIQMICMWYDGEPIGDKRTDVYKEMLVYLFKLAEKRRPTEMCRFIKEQTTEPKLESDEGKYYFQEMKRFFGNTRVSSIMFKLAELAFHGLCISKKEDALIFSHSEEGIRTLSKEDVEDCLTIGFLSQEKLQRKVTRREKLLSFTHKTFQEFFAALHIASGDETILNNMFQRLRSLNDIFEQMEVLIFMAGFKPELLSKLSQHIAKVVDSDQRILSYRNHGYERCSLVVKVQEIILSCTDECGESGSDNKIELHDVIVCPEELNGVISLHDEVYDDAKRIIQNLTPRLNYDNIKSLQAYVCTGDLLENINMEQIVKLDLVVESQEEIDLLARMMGRSVQNLAAFSLHGRPYRSTLNGVRMKNVLIEIVNAYHLTSLGIWNFKLNHDEIVYMCNIFSQWRQLEYIALRSITCQTCKADQCEYSINLSDNVMLRTIRLGDIEGDVLLGRKPHLDNIDIISCKHDSNVIQQLKDLKSLKSLYVIVKDGRPARNAILPTVPPASDRPVHSLSSLAITEVVPTLHNLNRLILNGVDLGDEDLSISCQTQGMEIELGRVTMTLKCLKTLVESVLQSLCRIYVFMMRVSLKHEQDCEAALQFIREKCNVTRDKYNATWSLHVEQPHERISIGFTNK